MKNYSFLVLLQILSVFFLISCNSKTNLKDADLVSTESYQSDYSAPIYTKKDGILTVLMDNSLASYFIYQGEAMGFEYEMLELFAKENDLKLEIKIVGNIEHILDSLVAGMGDIVAANLSISKDRMENAVFSKPLFRTKQVLIQRLPENIQKLTKDEIEASLIRDRLDLKNKIVTVRKNSSYEEVLNNLISETGLELAINYAEGDIVTDQLIDMVSNKEIDFTICDLNKAEIFNAYYDNIDIETPMSLSQPIAWAVNKESTELQEQLNSWIDKRAGSLEFNMINNRYFEMTKRKEHIINEGYDFVKEGKISEYDDLIKKYAAKLNWDWRLLIAQIYKESKFDPDAKSWRGAVGLMQIMPRTAKSYGLQSNQLNDPEKNIMAGTKHIRMLEKHWKTQLADSLEIIKFTLGSYNVGQGHVEDAIRLTEKYQLDPTKWDDNVAKMLLNKSIPKYYKDPDVIYGYCRGREPVNYVSSILDNYNLYSQFTN